LVQGLGSGKELHVPKNITEVAALSGVPAEHAKRTVVITQRMNKTLQSGQKFVHQWQIYWKNTERWSNPLMGWTSSADPMSNVKVVINLFGIQTLF
jgi:NADH dehydrogenase (ubiquinone) Fe-S protein 4